MSNKFNYDSYGNSIDGTKYCSGVETYAQNLIEDNENDATIIFPSKDGWITPRSELFYITDESAEIILPQSIYKIISVEISINQKNGDCVGGIYRETNTGTFDHALSSYQNSAGEFLSLLDITKYVVSEEIYQTLEVIKDAEKVQSEKLNKGNVFYYKNDRITISGGRMSPLWEIFNKSYVNWKKLIQSVLTYEIGDQYYYDNGMGAHYYLSDFAGGKYLKFYMDDIRNLQFRITYIPMSSNIKLRARKSAKTNVDYIQPINQRAEINSASALGKFLYHTAQKTGTEQITIVKWYNRIKDIPKVGAWVKKDEELYILTANNYDMTDCERLKVTHTLSKNWSNKSQHVAVDQKYRNYNIPAELLWRNLYWEDFVEVTTDGVAEGAEAGSLITNRTMSGQVKVNMLPRIFLCDKSSDVTVTSFFLRKDGLTEYGVTVPCVTMGIANSLLFSASMKDQFSAGLQIDPDQPQFCKEVCYCEEDGTMENGEIVLSGKIDGVSANDYPQAHYTAPDDIVFDKSFYLDKDPGEALKFTYQVHFVSDNPLVVIGSKMTEHHPLVKHWEQDRKFKFWILDKYLRPGADKVYSSSGTSFEVTTEVQRKLYWGISDYTDPSVKAFKLQLTELAGLRLNGKKAWAITDEKDNLYIGINDVTKKALYFTHIHKRK